MYLLIIVFILAIYLAVITYKHNKISYFLISFLLVFSSYGISNYTIIVSQSVFWTAIFFNHSSPFWLLPGPLLYFYVKGTLKDENPLKNKWEYLHFLPSIIQLIGIIPYCLKPFIEKEEIARQIIANTNYLKDIHVNWLYPKASIGYIFRPITSAIYAVVCCLNLIKLHPIKNKDNNYAKPQATIVFYWLVFIISITCLISINVFIEMYFITFSKHLSKVALTLPSFFVEEIVALLLIVCLIIFPTILHGMPFIKKTKNTVKKIAKSENPFEEMAADLIQIINDKKLYLNKNFQIQDLANELNIPQHHILYCFDQVIHQNFSDYVTLARIQFAKELIEKGEADSLPIEALAENSGFASTSIFQNAFKKVTGHSLIVYIEKHKKKNE